jgi:hypothetical protein
VTLIELRGEFVAKTGDAGGKWQLIWQSIRFSLEFGGASSGKELAAD